MFILFMFLFLNKILLCMFAYVHKYICIACICISNWALFKPLTSIWILRPFKKSQPLEWTL